MREGAMVPSRQNFLTRKPFSPLPPASPVAAVPPNQQLSLPAGKQAFSRTPAGSRLRLNQLSYQLPGGGPKTPAHRGLCEGRHHPKQLALAAQQVMASRPRAPGRYRSGWG